jgi:chitinase
LWAGNVIGYFTNWGIYGDQPYNPENVPYEKLTHIQYAFFNPQINGDIASFDTEADEKILFGKMVWYPKEEHDSTTSLIYLAHKNNVKVLASVGGWTGSSNFPALASSAACRKTFCSKTRAMITKFNFDGVDIDWEYPGFSEHNGTPADAQNFVLLLSELRDTLDAMSGGKKLITLAIAGSSFHGKDFLIERFYQDVDYISIMTYDYTGVWGSYAWHNSPLYDYGNSENWSLDRSMQYYKERGVPTSKFNIGMAFYGKTFAGCAGPNASFTGAGGGAEPGSMTYSEIEGRIKSGEYIRYWDSTAMVPYCLSKTKEYCSYDDTVSIRKKAEYCVEKGYAGAIIWELKSGTLSDGSAPLLSAASKVLLPSVAVIKKYSVLPVTLNLINAMTGEKKLSVKFSLKKSSNVLLTIYDLSGRTIVRVLQQFPEGKNQIELSKMNQIRSGRYMLNVTIEGNSFQEMFSKF